MDTLVSKGCVTRADVNDFLQLDIRKDELLREYVFTKVGWTKFTVTIGEPVVNDEGQTVYIISLYGMGRL